MASPLLIKGMENDDFIASFLLSRASVEIQEGAEIIVSTQKEKQREEAQAKKHYIELRRKAIFCRAPKSQKALLFTAPYGEVA